MKVLANFSASSNLCLLTSLCSLASSTVSQMPLMRRDLSEESSSSSPKVPSRYMGLSWLTPQSSRWLNLLIWIKKMDRKTCNFILERIDVSH